MAFFEQEFIEITRENAKMKIVGTMKCSAEPEDVRQYIRSRIAKEKRAMVLMTILIVITWLSAVLPIVGELFLSNNPQPHIGGGTLVMTVIFSAIAVFCTVIARKSLPASKAFISGADPNSAIQIMENAPDAIIWKQNKKWELCHAHDLVPLESALNGYPVFLGSQRPTDTSGQFLRRVEEKALVEYAVSLAQSRTKAMVSDSDTLLVYLDIDKLGGGIYGLAAGKAIAKVLSANDLEEISLSSGDSAATLSGTANEYVVGLSGNATLLNRIEERLCNDTELHKLLSRNGIRRTDSNEPLAADGVVRGGELINPPGHSTSFCAAGFRDIWKANNGYRNQYDKKEV